MSGIKGPKITTAIPHPFTERPFSEAKKEVMIALMNHSRNITIAYIYHLKRGIVKDNIGFLNHPFLSP